MSGLKRGFTLVEVLIVIVIIGVLAGLLLPGLRMVQEKARSAYCQNNLHQFGLAFSTYTAQYGGQFPTVPQNQYSSMGHEPEYADHFDIYPVEFLCIFMRAEKRPTVEKTWLGGYRIDKVAICPSYPKDALQENPFASYAYNGHVRGPVQKVNAWDYYDTDLNMWATYGNPQRWPVGGSTGEAWWSAIMREDGDVTVKSELCVAADSADEDGDYGMAHDKLFHWSETMDYWQGSTGTAVRRDRHNGGANLAFYDGRTEWKYKDWLAEKANTPQWMHPCGNYSGAWLLVTYR